jgi:hypothetical protein
MSQPAASQDNPNSTSEQAATDGREIFNSDNSFQPLDYSPNDEASSRNGDVASAAEGVGEEAEPTDNN